MPVVVVMWNRSSARRDVTPSSKTIPSARHISAVAARSHLQAGERVRIDAVQEDTDIRALQVDLAEGRGIHHGHAGARRSTLAKHRVVDRFARLREMMRTLPLPDVLEDGPVRLVPGMDRGHPDRIGQRAPVARGKLSEADRHGRRSEGRHPDRADLLAEDRGGDGARDHARCPALVDPGPDRRVALDVLDRFEAGAERPLQVLHGRVATEVDIVGGPGVVRGGAGRRHDPGRGDVAEPLDLAGGRADDLDPAVRTGSVRDEGRDPLVEPEGAPSVGPERDVRVPAAGYEQEVRLDRLRVVAVGTGVRAAVGARDADARQSAGVVPRRADDEVAPPRIHDGDDLRAGSPERGGHGVRRVVVREDDRPFAGADAVTLHVRRRGPGQHDPGPVVVGEDDRPLRGPGRDDDPPGPDVPRRPSVVGVGRRSTAVT
ncbi:MAG: hypothetical protein WKF78_10015 [Candidatus Limnocylindrales bacterium]